MIYTSENTQRDVKVLLENGEPYDKLIEQIDTEKCEVTVLVKNGDRLKIVDGEVATEVLKFSGIEATPAERPHTITLRR